MSSTKTIETRIQTISDLKPRFAPLVARLRRTFKWYDAMVIAAGYDLDKDPARLPYIDEHILTEHYNNAQGPEFEDCTAYYTSGTSNGSRKRILYSAEDHDLYVQQRQKIFARFLTPKCKKACSDLGTGHAASSAKEILEGLGVECFHIDFRRPISEHIAILNEHRPDVLFTMPMVLDSLIQARKLTFQPRKIIIVGDVASSSWKQRILDHFWLRKRDLLDIVGSIEVGSIAYECFDCDLYHFDDHIIPETIKPSELYEDFNDRGTAEILILTSLARFVFPAIRFITNDLIEGFTTRTCRGLERYSFERIIGRTGSEFKNGENISLDDINQAVNTFLPASPFEVQKDSGRFIIRVCSPKFTEEIGERIKNLLKELNPNSHQMIKSSLVQDIEICKVSADELAPHVAKRLFLVRKKIN